MNQFSTKKCTNLVLKRSRTTTDYFNTGNKLKRIIVHTPYAVRRNNDFVGGMSTKISTFRTKLETHTHLTKYIKNIRRQRRRREI